ALKAIADAHNLSRSLHLASKGPLSADKFIQRQSWEPYQTVIQQRLEACIGLSCNGILDLIQGISQRDLCSYFSNRISCSFGSQCRRTGYTGIYLDYTILKAVRIQGILYITAACDTQLCDN